MSGGELLKNHGVPPFDWYSGHGFENTGITLVLTSGKFWRLGNGKVGQIWGEWCQLQNAKLQINGSHNLEILAERAREINEELIRTVGFSPVQIRDFGRILTDNYAGKFDAPFNVKLVRTTY